MSSNSDENLQVLNIVQALLGGITPNFRAVFLKCASANAVTLTFVLEKESEEDQEEIGDIVFEFEALQEFNVDVELRIIATDKPLATLAVSGRMVYSRKE